MKSRRCRSFCCYASSPLQRGKPLPRLPFILHLRTKLVVRFSDHQYFSGIERPYRGATWNRQARELLNLNTLDNSVTSLQFDDTRIVSGGSDGRVKIWSLESGQLVRELSQPAEAVWRVAFEEEKAVIMASRSNRTVMEVRLI